MAFQLAHQYKNESFLKRNNLRECNIDTLIVKNIQLMRDNYVLYFRIWAIVAKQLLDESYFIGD